MSGVLGLNIRGQGMSAENVVAYQRRLKAHTHLVLDEPKLAALLVSECMRVIYRRSDDDHAHTKFNPVLFVRDLHAAAPAGCYLSLGNEPGRGSLGALADWTDKALRECERLGRKAVIFNFETGNPNPDDWNTLAPVLDYARRGGHLLGLHAYFDGKVEDQYKGVPNTLVPLSRFGAACPEIVITELGAAIRMDPHIGYGGYISSEAYAAELAKCAQIYSALGIAVNVYMYGVWHNFGIQDDEVVKNALILSNERYQVKEISVEFRSGIVESMSGSYANVRAGYTTRSPVVGKLVVGAAVVYRPTDIKQDGYTWLQIDQPVRGYVAAEVCRIRDTPPAAKVLLPVPYMSQLAVDAAQINNDCPESCAWMLIQYDRVRKQQRTMPMLTVDMMVRKRQDVPQPLTHITALLDGFGVDAKYARPITLDVIVKELDAGRAVIALVAYKHIKADSFTGGHYVVFVGYSADGYYIHDPYKGGANFYLRREAAERALSDVSAFAAFSYQGVVLV